jgi:hypothetical protein
VKATTIAPTPRFRTTDGVNVTTTDTAAFDSNVNVAILKWLELEVLLLE